MIKVGDKIPSAKLMHMTKDGPRPITTDELFDGKKVVLFALPGAFTPTCSAKHLPGFVQNADALKAKGVDTIACLSVNDAFVMNAWAKDQNIGRQGADAGRRQRRLHRQDGPGLRCLRLRHGHALAALRHGGRRTASVKTLNVEEPGAFEVSSAESILKAL